MKRVFFEKDGNGIGELFCKRMSDHERPKFKLMGESLWVTDHLFPQLDCIDGVVMEDKITLRTMCFFISNVFTVGGSLK